MLTGDQIRMARGALKWSISDLAIFARVGKSTIQRLEAKSGVPSASTRTIISVQETFENAGIKFYHNKGEVGISMLNGAQNNGS